MSHRLSPPMSMMIIIRASAIRFPCYILHVLQNCPNFGSPQVLFIDILLRHRRNQPHRPASLSGSPCRARSGPGDRRAIFVISSDLHLSRLSLRDDSRSFLPAQLLVSRPQNGLIRLPWQLPAVVSRRRSAVSTAVCCVSPVLPGSLGTSAKSHHHDCSE